MLRFLFLLLLPATVLADVTLDLSLGVPVSDETNYYGSDQVGIVDLCYLPDGTHFRTCFTHISKIGPDACGQPNSRGYWKCYGDNWVTIGLHFKLLD